MNRQMIAERNFGQCVPITWLGRFPVYLATAIAGAQLLAMVFTALAMAAAGTVVSANPILSPLVFNWESAVRGGQLWQFVTYAFVNPPSIWVVIQILMLGMFGREVEKFLGRTAFFWLFVALVLTGSALATILGLLGMGTVLVGAGVPNFVVFIAFAMIHPRAEIFFGLQARWLASGLLVISSLQYLAAQDTTHLAILLGSCIATGVFLYQIGVRPFELPRFAPARKPIRPRHDPQPASEDNVHESIDPILEKISRTGIASLTRNERTRLERARTALIEKEQH